MSWLSSTVDGEPGGLEVLDETVTVVEQTDTYVVATWKRLMLLIWRGRASAVGIERSRAHFESWVNRTAVDSAFLIVVAGDRTRAPDGETFQAMASTAMSPVAHFKGMAALLESRGFVASSVRTIMMRIHSIAAREDPPLVFGTTAKAAEWAAQLLGDPAITASSLDNAIATAQRSQ